MIRILITIQDKVRYDEDTWVSEKEKLSVRMYITVKKGDEPELELEVILIAQYKDNKIFRLWELTFPDWSQISTFNEE